MVEIKEWMERRIVRKKKRDRAIKYHTKERGGKRGKVKERLGWN